MVRDKQLKTIKEFEKIGKIRQIKEIMQIIGRKMTRFCVLMFVSFTMQ